MKAVHRIPLVGAVGPYRGASWLLELGPDSLRLFDEYGTESGKVTLPKANESIRTGFVWITITVPSGSIFRFKRSRGLIARINLYLAQILAAQGSTAVEQFRRRILLRLVMPSVALIESLDLLVLLVLSHRNGFLGSVALVGIGDGLAQLGAAMPDWLRLRALAVQPRWESEGGT